MEKALGGRGGKGSQQGKGGKDPEGLGGKGGKGSQQRKDLGKEKGEDLRGERP